MKEAVFQYKCRLCGKVYDGCCCGEEIAFNILIGTLLDFKELFKRYKGMRPHMVENHCCDEKTGNYGVGDLIGFIIRGAD
jgi:hypothetical protein